MEILSSSFCHYSAKTIVPSPSPNSFLYEGIFLSLWLSEQEAGKCNGHSSGYHLDFSCFSAVLWLLIDLRSSPLPLAASRPPVFLTQVSIQRDKDSKNSTFCGLLFGFIFLCGRGGLRRCRSLHPCSGRYTDRHRRDATDIFVQTFTALST